MKVQILQTIFWSHFMYNLSHFSTNLRPHYQNSFFLNTFLLFSTLNSRMSKNMCIWRHKLCNAKTGVGPTFTWSNEPWSNNKTRGPYLGQVICGFGLGWSSLVLILVGLGWSWLVLVSLGLEFFRTIWEYFNIFRDLWSC